MYKGGATLTPVTLINNFDYPFAAPAKLQFGLAASTGSITNYHEIRNMNIDVTNTGSLVAAVAGNDIGAAVCQGQQALIDVTANDNSANTGGAINKLTVDLDPSTAGIQASYTDPLKGSYVTDSNGIVTFTPVNGFTGSSSANYTVKDNYGMVSNTATLTVTAGTNTGPNLVLSNPPAACFPAVIDITSNAWKTLSTPGAAYSYYTNLADANNAANNINLLANVVTVPGTYFVRAALNGCATVKPITVDISLAPTVASAGSDQSYCSSTGTQTATLLAVNPDIGIGAWTLVSGPASPVVTYPGAATSPVSFTQQGVYTFRYSVVSGACAVSADDIDISIGNTTANAGPDQLLSSASSITLAGNSATVGAGKWTLTGSPAGSTVVITQPTNPASSVQINRTGDYTFRWTMTNGSCNNNDLIMARIMSLLPVTLIQFTANLQGENVLLQWQTAAEQNNKSFDVEMSTDGEHFNWLQTVTGNGTTGGVHNYQYVDYGAAGRASVIYYRLRQTDMDGKTNYSSIIKITAPARTRMQCWPNPLQDVLYVRTPLPAGTYFDVALYNHAGVMLKQWQQVVAMNTSNKFDLRPLQLPKGIFVVKLSADGKSWEQQLIKL